MPTCNAIRGPTTSAPDVPVVTVTASGNVACSEIMSPMAYVLSAPALEETVTVTGGAAGSGASLVTRWSGKSATSLPSPSLSGLDPFR